MSNHPHSHLNHIVDLFPKKNQTDLLRVATMGVMAAGHLSTLNPHAPIFVPRSYRAVEDYSAEWWELVRSSPCFRDYWLCECFHDDAAPHDLDDVLESVVLADAEGAFDGHQQEEEQEKVGKKQLVSVGALKWRKPRAGVVKPGRYMEKVPKIVSVKVSPRPIQQPR